MSMIIELQPTASTEVIRELPTLGARKNPQEIKKLNVPLQFEAANGFSKKNTVIIIFAVTSSTLLASIVNGYFSVAIPTISEDINLDRSLILWPASIVSLVSGCTLLIAGAFSDVVGSKFVYGIGSLLQACAVLAAGLAQTGTQIIVFRGFMGLAQSLCLPASVSLITSSLPAGRGRNIGFACMGGGQPLGFSVGLILGGVLTSTVGWRAGMYIVAGLNAIVVITAALGLPGRESNRPWSEIVTDLRTKVDWIGALLISAALGLLSYVLGSISSQLSNIKSASSIAMLCIGVLLIPTFTAWMWHQARHGRPALIPNVLWRNRTFTSTCLCVFFTWGAFNTFEQLQSLWMQLVQQLSPLQASVRFLPQTVVGVIVNVVMGMFVHRVSSSWIIIVTGVFGLGAPILMALSQPSWSYAEAVFPAMILNVIGADCLYIISNLVISSVFPADTQGLAGGVFNTVAAVGKSVGLALSAVVTEIVFSRQNVQLEGPGLAIGYQASFWLCFGFSTMSTIIALLGLRKLGKVGVKED